MSIPLVSIVIPTYNAEKYILRIVNTLIHRKASFDYEIIIVDDASSDKTPKILKEISIKNKIRIFLKDKQDGPYACRNFGVSVAQGNILVFTEADCLPASHWLQKMTMPILNRKAKAVQGIIAPINSGFLIELEKARFDIYRGINTKSFAIGKETFDALGGFNESFLWWWGDVEFYRARMEKAGIGIYHQNAIVYYCWPKNPLKVLGKNRVYGLGRFRFLSQFKPSVSFHRKANYNILRFLFQCILDGGKETFKLTRERVNLPLSFKIAFFFYYLVFYVHISLYTYIYAKNPTLRRIDQKRLMY